MRTHTDTHVEGREETDHKDIGKGVTNRAHVSRECETTDRSQWYEKRSDKSCIHTHVQGM